MKKEEKVEWDSSLETGNPAYPSPMNLTTITILQNNLKS